MKAQRTLPRRSVWAGSRFLVKASGEGLRATAFQLHSGLISWQLDFPGGSYLTAQLQIDLVLRKA